MQTRYSLKKRLTVYVSIFSVLLGCFLIISAYRIALEEINEILDAQMQNLAERVEKYGAKPLRSDFKQHQHYSEEDLFVDVWEYKNRFSLNDTLKLLVDPVSEAGFYQHQTKDDDWRTYILPTENYQIQVSQQNSVREHLALELAINMFLPYVIFFPFAIWALTWLIHRNLRPLDDFKYELTTRGASELTPIQTKNYPEEIIPTINEMNYLFERILLSQKEQKQFVADAAHELRTPITALNLQTQILLKKFSNDDEIKNLSKGLIRVQHLVSQLLNLAKQDASINHLEALQHFDLNQLVVNTIEQLMQFAICKEIDLGMVQQHHIQLHAPEQTIQSIVTNIIDNAIKYTYQKGIINVSVLQEEGFALIVVEDSGPGIDPSQFNKIRKRFYRIYNHAEIGSGLGLSIVDKAIEHLHGNLCFSKSEELGGLKVEIRIPL